MKVGWLVVLAACGGSHGVSPDSGAPADASLDGGDGPTGLTHPAAAPGRHGLNPNRITAVAPVPSGGAYVVGSDDLSLFHAP
jgi:hypothetical protein